MIASMRRGRLLRLLGLAFLIVWLAPQSARAQGSPYGLVTHDMDDKRANKMVELGSQYARMSLRWWQVEPVKGQYNWEVIDDYVWNQAAPRGVRLFVSIGEPPEWAGGGSTHNGVPRNMQDWYAFVFAAVNRYKGYVRHWGVWNEPNLGQFLTDRSRYQDIVFWARKAIRAADPKGLVLGPEISEHAMDDGWFASVMASFGRDAFDIVTVHVYTGDLANRLDRQVDPWRYGKDVWLTEIGRQAFTGVSLSEERQRDYYRATLQTFEPRRSWLRKIFFYDIWAWDNGFRFGITGPDWSNHLAFDAYRDWIDAHRVLNTLSDTVTYAPATGDWMLTSAAAPQLTRISEGRWAAGHDVHVADFDGDGLLDVFRYDPASGAWSLGVNDGWGGFIDVRGLWSVGWQVRVVDLNGDRRADLFVYNPVTGVWVQCFSQGEGGFSYSTPGSWSPAWDLYPADGDGDGAEDLFLYNRSSGLWFWALSDRRGGFRYRGGLWSPDWTVAPGDFNRDGRADVFLYNAGSGQWFIAVNTGVDFRYRTERWSPGWTIRVADLNGDRRADVFVFNELSGLWFECLLQPDETFRYVPGLWSPGWMLSVVDFDRDGRDDLLLYSAASGAWYQAISQIPGGFVYRTGLWNKQLRIVTAGNH